MQVKDFIHKCENITDLYKLIDTDRFPHSLLLKGGAGRGKLATAMALAQYLICQNRKDGAACGACPNCKKATKGIHPDIHFSFPITGAKATCTDFMNVFRDFISQYPYALGSDWIMEMSEGKKAGNMTAAECNRISHIVHLKPYEADKKVIIIWLPEYLGKEGNRLLKMIEEPPEETYFIFVSDQPEQILATILSRCQIVNIPPVDTQTIASLLEGQYALDSEHALAIANLSDGSVTEAIKISKQGGNKFLPIWIKFFRAAYQGHTASISTSVSEVAALSKEEIKTFFQYSIHFLRQSLLLRHISQEHIKLMANEIELATKVIQVVDDEAIHGISAMLNDVSYHLERNANMKSSLLSMAIKMNRLLTKDAVVA